VYKTVLTEEMVANILKTFIMRLSVMNDTSVAADHPSSPSPAHQWTDVTAPVGIMLPHQGNDVTAPVGMM
jgi:hypothetical protein